MAWTKDEEFKKLVYDPTLEYLVSVEFVKFLKLFKDQFIHWAQDCLIFKDIYLSY